MQDFADFPLQKLAETYDLLVIDHPFVGFAAADGCLLPLDEFIDAAVLADQAANSVGPSHRSYHYGGHQWALATDAAGHVSAYRPDLIEEIGGLPQTWDEVLALAETRKRPGARPGRQPPDPDRCPDELLLASAPRWTSHPTRSQTGSSAAPPGGRRWAC